MTRATLHTVSREGPLFRNLKDVPVDHVLLISNRYAGRIDSYMAIGQVLAIPSRANLFSVKREERNIDINPGAA